MSKFKIIKRTTEHDGYHKCDVKYIEKINEEENKYIIEAKLEIDLNSKRALQYIEKANKKNTSILTMKLREIEKDRIDMLKDDLLK